MPKQITAVQEMIDAEVIRYPAATTKELKELAELIDERVAGLTIEEFREVYEQPARTATPTRRSQSEAAAKPSKRKGSGSSGSSSARRGDSRKPRKPRKSGGRKTSSARKGSAERKASRGAKAPASPGGAAPAADAEDGRAEGIAAGAGSGGAVDRDAARAALLDFATDLSDAFGDAGAVVRVMARIEEYVDRIVGGGR